MTNEKKDKKAESVVPLDKLVKCRRTGREFNLGEHQKCPYCYGTDRDIATGDHSKFCDFKPGEDPVCFGFPGNSSRDLHG